MLGIMVSGTRELSSDRKLEKAFTPEASLASSSLDFRPISLKYIHISSYIKGFSNIVLDKGGHGVKKIENY